MVGAGCIDETQDGVQPEAILLGKEKAAQLHRLRRVGVVSFDQPCGMKDYKEYLEMVLLTKNSHKDVVECSADQWLRFHAKKVNQTLKDIQFEPSIYGHIPQKLFTAAVRPCRMVGVVSVNVWDAIIIVLHCDSWDEFANRIRWTLGQKGSGEMHNNNKQTTNNSCCTLKRGGANCTRERLASD